MKNILLRKTVHEETNFTWAEQLNVGDLIELLNEYLS